MLQRDPKPTGLAGFRMQDIMSCPMEGTYLLERAADEIITAAHTARWASSEGGGDSRVTPSAAVSSDDLLPLFIAAIVQVRVWIWVQLEPCEMCQQSRCADLERR